MGHDQLRRDGDGEGREPIDEGFGQNVEAAKVCSAGGDVDYDRSEVVFAGEVEACE